MKRTWLPIASLVTLMVCGGACSAATDDHGPADDLTVTAAADDLLTILQKYLDEECKDMAASPVPWARYVDAVNDQAPYWECVHGPDTWPLPPLPICEAVVCPYYVAKGEPEKCDTIGVDRVAPYGIICLADAPQPDPED